MTIRGCTREGGKALFALHKPTYLPCSSTLHSSQLHSSVSHQRVRGDSTSACSYAVTACSYAVTACSCAVTACIYAVTACTALPTATTAAIWPAVECTHKVAPVQKRQPQLHCRPDLRLGAVAACEVASIHLFFDHAPGRVASSSLLHRLNIQVGVQLHMQGWPAFTSCLIMTRFSGNKCFKAMV